MWFSMLSTSLGSPWHREYRSMRLTFSLGALGLDEFIEDGTVLIGDLVKLNAQLPLCKCARIRAGFIKQVKRVRFVQC